MIIWLQKQTYKFNEWMNDDEWAFTQPLKKMKRCVWLWGSPCGDSVGVVSQEIWKACYRAGCIENWA